MSRVNGLGDEKIGNFASLNSMEARMGKRTMFAFDKVNRMDAEAEALQTQQENLKVSLALKESMENAKKVARETERNMLEEINETLS